MPQRVDPFVPVRHARAQPLQPAKSPPRPTTAFSAATPVAQQRWLRIAQYVGLSLLIIVAGILVQFTIAGEILIAAYAVVVLLRRIPSRVTFLAALGSMGYIIFMLFINFSQVLLKNFAMYAFLLLLIGALSLAREARA